MERDVKKIIETFNALYIQDKETCIVRDDIEPMTFGFSKYTGICDEIGTSTTTNTCQATRQLIMTLSLSGHPLILDIAKGKIKFNVYLGPDSVLSETVDQLVAAKILKGMKILDLGCGEEPTFARCVRYMGAEVYTVDIKPSEMFRFDNEYFTKQQREIEIKNHIQLNLANKDALETILDKTQGEFDLITCAHLFTGSPCYKLNGYKLNGRFIDFNTPSEINIQKMANFLLKNNGFYFDANRDLYDFNQNINPFFLESKFK